MKRREERTDRYASGDLLLVVVLKGATTFTARVEHTEQDKADKGAAAHR